ncbi:hypothetical protein RchiOBHm_Chr7g0207841 [Rosa chinensis]|uniref:Uncharacterized protein n=1 Tax=Rosa chinensis TaxID=74649 RepID=A0A2P6P9J7_ROSCH|nr:hypothetical protein RchiOBHm_Chr7g0207841 [Rosa chinensis]
MWFSLNLVCGSYSAVGFGLDSIRSYLNSIGDWVCLELNLVVAGDGGGRHSAGLILHTEIGLIYWCSIEIGCSTAVGFRKWRRCDGMVVTGKSIQKLSWAVIRVWTLLASVRLWACFRPGVSLEV